MDSLNSSSQAFSPVSLKHLSRQQKEELAELLLERQRRIKENPLKYVRPHKKQIEASESTKSLRVLFWANRTGKSEWGGMEAAKVLLGQHKHIPEGDGWVFCPSFDEQKDTTQQKLLRYIPESRIVDRTWIRKGILKELVVLSDTGKHNKVTFKSYEQGREKAQGAGKRFSWFDEEVPKDIFDEVSVRSEAGEPLYLWMTMTPVKGMCFDEETLLMAKRGWVGIDDLEIGDEIYTVNKKTLELELKPVDFVYRGTADKLMISMHNVGFDSLTTDDHRWFVKNKKSGKYEVKETKELHTNHVIPRAFPASSGAKTKTYEDWFVALIGWIVTDGSYGKSRLSVSIAQSLTANAAKCVKIQRLIDESGCVFRINHGRYSKNGLMRHWTIKGDLAKRIRERFPGKMLDGQFLAELTKDQWQILYDAMLDGDGHRRKDGHFFVAHDRYRQNAEVLLMLCHLLGLRCNMSLEYGKYWRLRIQTSKRYSPQTNVCSLTRKPVEYKGRVWCPHTENETVIAMRNGTSYVSMNTWVYNDLYLNTSNKDLFVSTATWDDNPYLTEEQKSKMAGRLSAAALKVRREGKFMRQVGLVASWFDRSVHVMDFDEVPHGDIYMGIDFGFSNPAACLWVSVDRNENVWVYDGFYGPGMTNPVILDLIRQKEAATGLTGRVDRIGDSAQASDIKEMNEAGLRIVGVEKQSGTDTENWDEWRAKLMEDLGRITEEQPHPRIIISSQLVAYDDEGNPYNFLMRELENLRWEEVKYDGVVQPKSVWGRQPNHAIDALTYILATIEANRRRGTGRVLKTHGGKGLVQADEQPTAKRIIEAMKKANAKPVSVWGKED